MGRKHECLRINVLTTIRGTCDKHDVSIVEFTPVFTLFYVIQLLFYFNISADFRNLFLD